MESEICAKPYQNYIDGNGINSGRVVLHSDMNNFFASVECMLKPELTAFPVAVCGSEEDRHGIVLAKNYKAKEYGIKTAEPVCSALKKCPRLIIAEPHYDLYMEYSHRARKIYSDYTDRVEPFGADEAWLELTKCHGVNTLSDGMRIAEEIRGRIKRELGLTVSVGVSDNKAFAKLGSDYKKPDAVSVMSPENYAERIMPLDISELIFAGPKTVARLSRFGLHTVADVVKSSRSFMRTLLGVGGERLWLSASGYDDSPVSQFGEFVPLKSLGNSFTPPRDLSSDEDVRILLTMLADTVASRLRKHSLKASGISLSVRSSELRTSEKQCSLGKATDCTKTVFKEAYRLFSSSFSDMLQGGIRSMGIRCFALSPAGTGIQLSMFDTDRERLEKLSKIDRTVDAIRKRYGKHALDSGVILRNPSLAGIKSCDETAMRSSFRLES